MAGKKILIADDEQDTLYILEKKLKQNNYDVLSLTEGKEVVKKCKLYNPNLIILDIVMPGVDGYTVALSLREDKSLKSIPIIFMTAKELEYSGIEKRLLEIGYSDFISKPCVFEDLLKKIKATVG
jgi:two-component system alkaline phosphatase synthesis response regulator PhoP